VQYRFNALYTPTILQLAGEGRYGMRVVGRSQAAQGDLVMFNWPAGHPLVDHVGRLRSTNAMREDIETAEGNITNRMVLETRSITTVRAFIRDT
jgi:cell wall-associated NlpC family hydrolase